MFFARATLLTLVVATVASGCDDPHPTDPLEGQDDSIAAGPVDLMLRIPALTNEMLTTRSFVELTPDSATSPQAGPAGAPLEMRPFQQVFDPRTRVYFQDGYSAALGIHQYVGNVGSIRTTANVDYRAQYLGSHTSEKQQYFPFLLDFGRLKSIWVEAKVFSDHECGLNIGGDSSHAASWQFFQGGSAPLWGTSRMPSQAQPVSQPGCSRRTGESTGAEAQPGGSTCYYLITYDLDTGEILNADFLYCTSGGGTVI